LKDLRDLGNYYYCSELDKEIMFGCWINLIDHWFLDAWCKWAGSNLRQISCEIFLKIMTTTAKYLNGELEIPFFKNTKKGMEKS